MAFTPEELAPGFWIGDCRVEPRQNRILRGESEIRVERRVMDVLVCLAARGGEVVSRDTITEQVWGKVVVTDQALTNCISELRQALGDDRATHRVIETIPKRGYRLAEPVRLAPRDTATGMRGPATAAISSNRARLGALAVVVLGVLLTALWWWQRQSAPTLTSVAVLRFENAANDEALNYLALALPDEIATLLTHSQGLAVRPLDYVSGDDPLAMARERGVDHVVRGRYYLEDTNRLSLAIEAQHVRQERVVWRTRISVAAGDLLAMRRRIADGVREGLMPALGARPAGAAGAMPSHDEAYQLYLRSLALPQQPEPTRRAIDMLERAVTLEPDFAPAWHALGIRNYAIGTWYASDDAARSRSLAAHRRALEIDPGFIDAAQSIITYRTEAGDLEAAYREARELLERFGPAVQTHFALSYVLRYGGQLDAAQRHCELALARDPLDPGLRSCAYAYLYAGKLDRVMDYLRLDEGAFFVQWGTVLYHLRRDDRAAALHVARQAADEPTRRFMQPCLEGASGADLDAAVAGFVEHWLESGDPEANYALAPMLAFCGRPREAFRFLERAVDRGFCAHPALDLDPVWAPLREDPEFERIRARAVACFERFARVVEAGESGVSR